MRACLNKPIINDKAGVIKLLFCCYFDNNSKDMMICTCKCDAMPFAIEGGQREEEA